MSYKDKEKQKSFQREWQKKQHDKKRTYVLNVLGNKCCKCDNDDVRVLQVDHIEPALRKNVAAEKSQTTIRRIYSGEYDVTLFQLLCANCHAIKTYEERSKYWVGWRK